MLKISQLKVENLSKGCVTDNPSPRFSFALESDREGAELKSAFIELNGWKGQTTSQQYLPYMGEKLSAFKSYTAKITAIDNFGDSDSAEITFRTGRMGTPWRAVWITDALTEVKDKISPTPLTFRKVFTLTKKIKSAIVDVSALGIYELSVNGKRIGDQYFAPGFTSYNNHIQYQTFDITSLLSQTNKFEAVVAGGWAVGCINMDRRNKLAADKPALLLEVLIEYEDGTYALVKSDESWSVTSMGNLRYAEFYDGEVYDATIDMKSVEFNYASPMSLKYTPKLVSDNGAPVKSKGFMKPIDVFTSKSGERIFDFGQNFSGVIYTSINGKKGQEITFRHAEALCDGELYVKSLRTAKATIKYTCIDGPQMYAPRFTYMGFRYVGVKGIDWDDVQLFAIVLHSDLPEIGSFTCSNENINKLQSNILWSAKSNFVDIPTDCPQRDERLGWTGDIAVFAPTACLNFDMSRFFDKWLADLRFEQEKDGSIPMVVPKVGDAFKSSTAAGWADSCVLVPWSEYLARGDLSVLSKNYPMIKKYINELDAKTGGGLSFSNARYVFDKTFQYGDWCSPDSNIKDWSKNAKWVATAYAAYVCGIASQIAKILKIENDRKYYLNLRGKIIDAYKNVLTDKKGSIKNEFQAAYVLPLCFGMTKDEETTAMANNLARLVKENGTHLSTGFLSTPFILFALSDNGYADLAYELLMQDTYPSWLYEVKMGATTIWERWDALTPDKKPNNTDLSSGKEADEGKGMLSFNHYAFGSVGEWLYKRVAGIEPTSGGYKTFKIEPIIGGGLTHAKAEIESPYGKIISEWSLDGKMCKINVQVPVSTSCHIVLPNGTEGLLKSGKHSFEFALN